MINKAIVRVKGGLGNQLFIYSFAKYLTLKYGINVLLDNKTGFVKDQYNRKYLLDNFDIGLKDCSLMQAAFIPLKKRAKFVTNNFFRNSILFEEESFHCDFINDLKYNEKTLYLEGYWQKKNYVEEFALSLRKDLQIHKELDEYNILFSRKINTTESVAIHFRKIRFSSTLDLSYYTKAILQIKTFLPNPVFFIFSDDIEWCKNNLKFNEDIVFIENNKSDEIKDIWLLSQCKHFILSNSTFSWWGYWLSENESKIVIKPNDHFLSQ